MSVVLLVNISGEVHPLTITKRPLILGRSKKCNVRFADNLMSSKHCEIVLNDIGRVEVKDLNSTNGTYINEIKVEAGHVFIGDTLRVGNITMKVDGTKLTRSEREALTGSDHTTKRARTIAMPKRSSSGKTQLVQDFTQINLGGDDEVDGNSKTYIIGQDEINAARKRKEQSGNKLSSKKKVNAPKRDRTGFFSRILKSMKGDSAED